MTLLPVLLVVAMQAPPVAAEKAVVLPTRLAGSRTAESEAHARAVEQALADALARHASFQVLGRSEIIALVGKAAQEQLAGCDAESCVAEIAEGLDAGLLVTSTLDKSGGFFGLQVSLLERRTANARARAAIKARSLDALLQSMDALARKVCGGSSAAADDPRLQERLGTDATGLASLREVLASRKDSDVVAAWTALVVGRNGEKDWMTWVESLSLLLGGMLLNVGGVCAGLTWSVHAWALDANNWFGVGDTRNMSWVPPLVSILLVFPFLAGASVLLLLAGSVGVADALDLGRVPVARGGCCRDEDEIEDAERPSVARRLAPHLAAVGSMGALLAPLAYYCTSWACQAPMVYLGIVLEPWVFGPSVPGSVHDARLFTAATAAVMGGLVLALGIPFGVTALGAALVLMFTERASLLDDTARVAVPAGKPADRGGAPPPPGS